MRAGPFNMKEVFVVCGEVYQFLSMKEKGNSITNSYSFYVYITCLIFIRLSVLLTLSPYSCMFVIGKFMLTKLILFFSYY